MLHRAIDRIGYSSDASLYRLIPEVVVQPENEHEVQALFRLAKKTSRPVVFRAAGTSLSGQSITNGILMDIGHHWRGYSIRDEGEKIRLESGVIGGHANRYLDRYNRKIGPDPASISACMIGGIIANNASGMRCGVKNNAYHTLKDIRFILPNGHLYDTADPEARTAFRKRERILSDQLSAMKEQIESDPYLRERIRTKYGRKNTMGYSLNAFIDFEEPLDIFAHLLVGSEGTLAFISDVILETLPDPPHKATAVVVFPSLGETVDAVWPLQRIGAEAVELMDRASLRSVEGQKGIPSGINEVHEAAASLLVEFQAPSEKDLQNMVRSAEEIISKRQTEYHTGFSTDDEFRDRLWKIRKGLYPSVGAVRDSGTSVIIEDIAFPLEDLAEATQEVRDLLDDHGYEEGIIFGHAKDGNLHFVIAQEFDDTGVQQYKQLINSVVDLVVGKYDGALKAEHGTGRNMAPFVEREWGEVLYQIMGRLKRAVDPDDLLNPGVIINENPNVYLENFKPLPSVEEEIDTCVECGFCEPVCPSADLTTSPRRRIVLWREITRLETGSPQDQRLAKELKKDYRYAAVETCAADSMCSAACPVDIDTGKMMKQLRERAKSPVQLALADWTVEHFTLVTKLLRFGLGSAREIQGWVGRDLWNRMMKRVHTMSGGKIPAWNPYFPGENRTLFLNGERSGADLVYMPSCLNRNMGALPEEHLKQTAEEAFRIVLERADLQFRYPENVEDLCCGTPWSSKGYREAFRKMAERTTEALWRASEEGALTVVMDTSPCSYTMKHYDEILEGESLAHWYDLRIYDIIEYLWGVVLPELELQLLPGTAVCHPTCSTTKMEHEGMLHSIAARCAEEAVIPDDHGCCGFAGDRGLLHPELTRSATRRESEAIRGFDFVQGYYSTSRTCEVGMSDAVGQPFSSIIHLVEKASRR